MATEVAERPGVAARVSGFWDEIVTEMRKVTWPDQGQIRQATIASIILVLFIGAVIGLLDVVLQQLLVKLIPSLFGGA
jgi:preprotein translocase subunit SecE